MTAHQQDQTIKQTSEEMLDFLEQKHSAMSAKSLIREYCSKTNVKPADAELAMVRLLNQGLVETNRDLKLQVSPLEYA